MILATRGPMLPPKDAPWQIDDSTFAQLAVRASDLTASAADSLQAGNAAAATSLVRMGQFVSLRASFLVAPEPALAQATEGQKLLGSAATRLAAGETQQVEALRELRDAVQRFTEAAKLAPDAPASAPSVPTA